MSTAVAPFFDTTTDVLYQNLLNNALSARLPQMYPRDDSPARSRNSSGDSAGSVPSLNGNTVRLLSAALHADPATAALMLSTAQGPQHRRLDRSVSEPLGAGMDRLTPSQLAQLPPLQLPLGPQVQPKVNSSRYKTELCRPFEENGYCKYGDKCQFAHGVHEVRSLSRHPKYKTELCRTYHTIGFCPYGPRCHFIHSEDERKLCQLGNMRAPPAPQAVPMRRPRALDFSGVSLASLGSTADSPPASITDSPSLSPTSFFDEDLLGLHASTTTTASGIANRGFNVPATAPPGFNPFTFPGQRPQDSMHPHGRLTPPTPGQLTPPMQSLMTPLNVQTSTDAAVASLAAGIQAATLAQRDTKVYPDCMRDMIYSPPTPPTSGDATLPAHPPTCGSPLDVSRNLRLPIFSQLVHED